MRDKVEMDSSTGRGIYESKGEGLFLQVDSDKDKGQWFQTERGQIKH